MATPYKWGTTTDRQQRASSTIAVLLIKPMVFVGGLAKLENRHHENKESKETAKTLSTDACAAKWASAWRRSAI